MQGKPIKRQHQVVPTVFIRQTKSNCVSVCSVPTLRTNINWVCLKTVKLSVRKLRLLNLMDIHAQSNTQLKKTA